MIPGVTPYDLDALARIARMEEQSMEGCPLAEHLHIDKVLHAPTTGLPNEYVWNAWADGHFEKCQKCRGGGELDYTCECGCGATIEVECHECEGAGKIRVGHIEVPVITTGTDWRDIIAVHVEDWRSYLDDDVASQMRLKYGRLQ